MIRIYVEVTDTDGSMIVDDHYEFETVPRIGERVILDNRGGLDEQGSSTPLRVIEVVNHATPKGDVANPISYIELHCKVIG
ncbi:hypothetical protein [Parasphingorhabdus cellanae]|uniref:Uncharacterized protein n=1 Tax=Parasphingorhabdus cellanae TaxID=2806553 RepID=A0ABX7T2D8_9SPHN|nr:hypothetical protein [Parasphingorhabdus cellanae]QTD54689.1 hypothetical protein J4G78_10485 [Parasphingorhabdus cellanae]